LGTVPRVLLVFVERQADAFITPKTNLSARFRVGQEHATP